MSDSIFVKPAPGLIVRDPETRAPLPPEGKQVPRSVYWIRRLRDGDAIEGNSPAPADAEGSRKSNKR